MDILYIIGKGSKHNNIELKYSLRSICKYGKNIGKVIVAGSPPDWLSKEVVQVSCSDPYSYKHSNILNCIENVVDKGLVSGDFLYSSDDHFYIKPTDFDNYPIYLKSEALRDTVKKNDRIYQYHRSLVDTRMILETNGFPFKNYSQHCNTHMHSEIFVQYRDFIHQTYKLRFGAEPTSVVLNIWSTHQGFPPVTKRRDIKIDYAESVQDMYNHIGDREAFSIGDAIFNGLVWRDFFSSEFPEKCELEM